MNKDSIAFTDGSSRGNPGPGGWGVVIVFGDRVVEYGGREDNTTNNRMELKALIEAVKRSGESMTVYSDSVYVINGFTKWIHDWKKRGWINKAKEEVMNQDLWKELDSVSVGKKIKMVRVRGHVGVVGNERCDEIATAFADRGVPSLYDGNIDGYSVKNILDISDSNGDDSIHSKNKKPSKTSKGKAYSYVSAINGVILVHSTWGECELRVKGKSGARYKKALSKDDEENIKRDFAGI